MWHVAEDLLGNKQRHSDQQRDTPDFCGGGDPFFPSARKNQIDAERQHHDKGEFIEQLAVRPGPEGGERLIGSDAAVQGAKGANVERLPEAVIKPGEIGGKQQCRQRIAEDQKGGRLPSAQGQIRHYLLDLIILLPVDADLQGIPQTASYSGI